MAHTLHGDDGAGGIGNDLEAAALEVAPELARWRAYNESPAEPCASCTMRPVCKGGCKVVSSYVEGVHGPDPECPRVRAWRAAAAATDEPAEVTA